MKTHSFCSIFSPDPDFPISDFMTRPARAEELNDDLIPYDFKT